MYRLRCRRVRRNCCVHRLFSEPPVKFSSENVQIFKKEEEGVSAYLLYNGKDKISPIVRTTEEDGSCEIEGLRMSCKGFDKMLKVGHSLNTRTKLTLCVF